MVSIFTYRDERKLFAVIAAVIVAAAVTLAGLDAQRSGKPSSLSIAVSSVGYVAQSVITTVVNGVRSAGDAIVGAPGLAGQNHALRNDNRRLRAQNARLREALAAAPAAEAIARAVESAPGGIAAAAIGYDPEATSRTIVIDRGGTTGVHIDDGVIDDDGVVGRVVAVAPFESTVLLLTDAASKVPAVVQRGRWWGIATGTDRNIALQYVSQDAKLRVGDRVVTGEGRSFHAGRPIGRILRIDHPEGALYQTAILQPAVEFGRLTRVVIVPH
ncbi:MAG: rod shape-determining protein MreC [Candidatus Eremiobacteraeota bacterium]|nr:rod shape-determining protein MreC [Candidatus Eremiobacteraeota bacterium]